ncbi:MAG TPA: hypothetical protein VH593_28800 [Ktedonobacteraceae bacterium]
MVILLQIQTPSGTFELNTKSMLKVLIYTAALVAVFILSLAVLVFAVTFLFHLAFSLFLQASIAADHAGALTQVLLLLVVGFVLYRIGKCAAHALRSFLVW